MGGGSTDSASTTSPETSEQMNTRDEEDLDESQQAAVSNYAEAADGEPAADEPAPAGAAAGAGASDSDSESFPTFQEFIEGKADLPDDPAEADALDDELLEGLSLDDDGDDIDELLDDDEPRTYSDEAAYEAVAVDGAAEADTPREFAQTVLNDGAVATRYCEGAPPAGSVVGADGAFPPAEPGTHRYGGWSDFDPDEGQGWKLLPNTDDYDGRTARYMEVGDYTDAPSTGTGSAYVTHYDDSFRPTLSESSPDRYYAHKQMVGYAFTDAVGARVPPHTFNKAEDWVAVGGVNAVPVDKISPDSATNVDRGEFIDQMAVSLLAGNTDLHTGNVFIGEDGAVCCVDMDMSGYQFDSYDAFEQAAEQAEMTAGAVDRTRPAGEKMDVSAEEVATRAQEIAVSLHVSGEKERVYETLESYDQLFEDYYSPTPSNGPYGEGIKQNIEVLINAARYHNV